MKATPWTLGTEGMEHIERDAIVELLRHAVAAAAGQCYPTIWFGRRAVDRYTRKKARDAQWQVRLGAVLSSFFGGIQIPDGSWASIHELATSLSSETTPLRVYVVLTECYNFALTGRFSGREWLSPWDTWDLYLPPPMWACEGAFLKMCSSATGMDEELLAEDTFGEHPATVGRTIARIADSSALSDAGRVAVSKTDHGEWASDVAHPRTPFSEKEASMVGALRHYLITGSVGWRRRWWGWEVAGIC